MSAVLTIAKDLSLPLDAATQKLAFMGRTGSGKTYAASKVAEEMLDAGIQVVILDPVGVWYGLRLAANGTDPGIAIPIFGGLHGDIPLEPTGGAVVANAIVDRKISAVIDVSQMISSEQMRFATAFATQFYERQKAAPSAVFMFLEECQEFIPQQPQQGEQHMLHAFQRMCKIGRNFGIGVGLISQRPQEIAKKVLNMTECFFAFQMTGPQERKAIRDYVSEKGGDLDIVAELPKYAVGQCHVWSPQWLQISRTVKILPKRTYNASSTPKVGARPVEARALAAVDLDALRTQMADTIERAKAEDPAELRKQLADRDRKIRTLESAKPAATVDRAAIDRAVSHERERLRAVTGANRRKLDSLLLQLSKATTDAVAEFNEIVRALSAGPLSNMSANPGGCSPSSNGGNQPSHAEARRTNATVAPADTRASRETVGRDRQPTTGDGSVSAPQRRILDAIAFYASIGNETPAKRQVAGFVGVNPSTSTWRGYLAPLRAGGYLEDVDGDRLRLTDHGRSVARIADVPSRDELLDQWTAKLSTASATILRALAAVYPATLESHKLAARIGVEASTSTWRGYLAPLRKLGLVDDVTRGELRASELLFPEGLK